MTNIKVKITRRTFEKHLNRNAPPQGDSQWIIGGKIRMAAMWTDMYGTALRKHDPQQFDVLYNEWKRNK